MNLHYSKVIVCVLLTFSGYNVSLAQSTDPEFIDCSTDIYSLCVQDEGVRLPANNQLYLGEGHPDASSCSVHVTQKKRVKSHCGDTMQYEVILFLNDSSSIFILKEVTTVITDSLGEAELSFNTEESPDENIRQSGIPYTRGCGDAQQIKWVVTDPCGGFSVCEQRIELYDCSLLTTELSSSPYIAIIPIGCQGTLHAKDFYFGGLDDCSLQEQLSFSFEEHTYIPDRIITCPEAVGVELTWKIWIADEGRGLNCDGQIDWNEKNRVELPFQIVFYVPGHCHCDMPIDPTLTGQITTVGGNQGMNNVHVSLLRTGHVFPTYVTGPDGIYNFQINLSGAETVIKPEKNDGHKNGVSTLDLVKIQKHLLGIDPFTTLFQYIAADINNSQNVSAIDLIELRKLILGIYSELPFNKSWCFVAKEFNFQDTMQPWTYSEIISFTNELPENADFYGVKIGDLNNTALPNFTQLLPRESLPPFEFITDQQAFQAGEVIDVDFRMPSNQMLTGFQFTLATQGMQLLNILPGKISFTEEHYALMGDQMTVSWFDENELAIIKDEVLFTLQFRTTTSGTLGHSLSINSDITAAEIYLDGTHTFQPVLAVQHQDHDNTLEIISCNPNPWKEETTIYFYLPASDVATFRVLDVAGKELSSTSMVLQSGYHQHRLTSSDFAERGMLFFEVSSSTASTFHKMIVLE